MGCSGSKDGGKDDKTINSDFDWVHLTRFDSIFYDAAAILKNCEEIRSGLEDTKEEAEEYTGTDLLKEGKFTDTLNVLLWALSSQGEGKIKNVDTNIITSVPFIELNNSKLLWEQVKVYDAFATYAKTVTDSPSLLKENVEKLLEIVEQAPKAMEEAKGELEGKDFRTKIDSIAKMSKNISRLSKEVKKCQKLQELLKTAVEDLKLIVPKLNDMLKAADEIGAKAHAEGLKKPKEIFLKFHTGERKPEDPKKDAKAAEKKKSESKSPEKKGESKSPEKKSESKSPEKKAEGAQKK